MSNPFLNPRYYDERPRTASGPLGTTPGASGAPQYTTYDPTARGATMTMGGVSSAAGVMLVFLLAGAWFGWTRIVPATGVDSLGRTTDVTTFPTGWFFGSLALAFVLSIVCSFRPLLARVLAIPFAVAEGVFVGVVSHTYDLRTQGVALQAVLATVAVFGVMLLLYGFRVLRVTPRMTKAIIAATFGIAAVYLVGWISSIFTDALPRFMDSTSTVSIGISALVVGVAAFNLLLDFDFIERGVEEGYPKNMEWFAAFGLIVTIVWLYLELLRLLSKLQRR